MSQTITGEKYDFEKKRYVPMLVDYLDFTTLDLKVPEKYPIRIRTEGCGCCSESIGVDKANYVRLLKQLIAAFKAAGDSHAAGCPSVARARTGYARP